MTKRLLALLLCLVMLASLFPAAAFAEGSIAAAEEDAGAEAPGGPEDDGAPAGGTIAPAEEPEDEPEPGEGSIAPVGADAPGGPENDPDALAEEPAADEIQEATASGTCGDNLTWSLENGVLTISGTGAMTNWSSNSDVPWYSYRETITSLVLPRGLTNIGNYAFCGCKYVTGVTIPDSVTSIGNVAFSGCSGLTSVMIPDSVTSIGNVAFFGCSGLISVEIPPSVTHIRNETFYGCSSLTSVKIPSSVTSIGYWAFYYCSSLTSVEIPSSVTSVGNQAFYGCSGLKTAGPIGGDYDLRFGWTTSIPARAFRFCSSLTSVTIPGSVTSIGDDAFYNCSSLTSVTIPEGVTSIGDNAFSYCSGLTSVEIPNSVTSIGYDVFSCCSSLTDINFGGTIAAWKQFGLTYDHAKVSVHCTDGTIAADPSRCGEDLIWTLSDDGTLTIAGTGDMWDWSYNSGAPWNSNSSSIKTAVIQPGVTSIGSSAFRDCSSLTSVTIPAGVTSIGEDAFSGCSGLTSVEIPTSVTSIGDFAFDNCSGLTSVTIPEGVTCVGAGAFSRCSSLTSVELPEGVTSIGIGAFAACSSLTSVTIPASATKITSALWATYGLFESCGALTDIWFGGTREAWATLGAYPCHYGATVHCSDGNIAPADPMYCGDGLMWTLNSEGAFTIAGTGDMWDYNLSHEAPWYVSRDEIKTVRILSGASSIGSRAFIGCISLESVEIPASVTSIGDSAFQDCPDLTSIELPDNLTSIGNSAFAAYADGGLTSITIPSSVTSIGNSAFAGCRIISITIPAGVASIGDYAFHTCSNLTEIRFAGAAPVFGEYVFGAPYGSPVIATAYYPANDPTWTAEVRQNYGGSITWVPYVADSAEVASGTCGANGDNLTWTLYENGTLLIRGSGAMAEYHRQYYSNSNAPWYAYRDRITTLVLPEGLTSIGGGAFYQCKYISRLELPATVKSIGYEAFYECSGIRGQLILPEGLTSLGNSAFQNCSGLTGQLILPVGLTSIPEYAFYWCTSLTEIRIPDSVTSIGNNAFYGCGGVRSITVPSGLTSIGQDALNVGTWDAELKVYIDDLDWWLGLSDRNGSDLPHGDLVLNGELVTEIAVPEGTIVLRPGMFRNMRSLTSVTIPESVTSIGNFAFGDCSSLTSVTIPSSVTNIGNYAFYNCRSLTEIQIPAGVTSIGNYAFYNCRSLTEIQIPAGVTSIENFAFSGCRSLTEIQLPAGVTSIAADAFAGCTALQRIDFLGDAPSFGAYEVFYSVTATALYPLENESWTADKRQNYDGTITWTPYRSEPADAPIAYAVAFDPNGGEAAPRLQYKGRGVDLSLSQAAPTRDYYSFLGWAADPAATEPDYAPGAAYATDADITLYAVWSPRSWPLQYQPSGGSGAPAEQTKTYGQPLTLSETVPEREGYEFLGWSPFYWDNTPRYFPGDSFDENGAADNADPIKLYAVWQIRMYLISYKANGGDEAPAPQLKTYGRAITLSEEIPTRAGYSFLGWAASRTAAEPEYQPGDRFTANADTVLYAIWELEADRPTVRVGEASGSAGREVQVPVSLEHSPGIYALTISFRYDTEALELVSVTPNTAAFPGNWQTATGATWVSNAGDIAADETLLTLTFRVKEGAAEGDYAIEAVLGDILNEAMEDIRFYTAAGKVTVTSHIPGDINGDGEVGTKDFVTLMKYLAGEDVYVVQDALDVNGDGDVGTKDFVTLMKYLAGEDVKIY